MENEGKYIYCIIKHRTRAPKESKHPTGQASTVRGKESGNQRFGFWGINNREVTLLSYKDIAAVVSPIPIINFDRLDKKELVRYVASHQEVSEKVMKDYDLVPMVFGIIAPSADEVLRILEKAYLQFKTALKQVKGKAEFVVQVWWNPKKLLEELVNINPEIQKLKQEISSKGDILALPIKLKLGKLVFQELETQRKNFINDIHAFLRNSSYDSTLNKLINEEMIANFSFLIEKNRESELDAKMQELGRKYEGKLRFKYIGPTPPYSFTKINLSLGNFELIDKARKLLGLAEVVSFDEIKKSYYILSHQYHPDKHQGDLRKEEQIKKINEARSILKNYCQSCDELLGQKNQKYSFKKEDVENSLIIK